jgi:hypothetical protein
MSVQLIVKITGGSGKITVCIPGHLDIDFDASGEYPIDLSSGKHSLAVYGRPPAEGELEITFKQGDTNLGSHIYKNPRSIFFDFTVD